MSWIFYAVVSAVAAALTAVLGKQGVVGVPSTLATAIRTIVVVVFAWAMVFALSEQREVRAIPRSSWFFLAASGLATGVSWLAYYRALQLGPASRVAPIDKLSLPLTVMLAVVLLGERVTWTAAVGVALMVAGGVLTLF
jgi:transporter family protein